MSVINKIEKCPFCKEKIQTGAVRCKHCHADLSQKKKKNSYLTKLNNFRTGFLTGILFMLVIVVLIYFQYNSSN